MIHKQICIDEIIRYKKYIQTYDRTLDRKEQLAEAAFVAGRAVNRQPGFRSSDTSRRDRYCRMSYVRGVWYIYEISWLRCIYLWKIMRLFRSFRYPTTKYSTIRKIETGREHLWSRLFDILLTNFESSMYSMTLFSIFTRKFVDIILHYQEFSIEIYG